MASSKISFHDHTVLGTFSTDEKRNYCNDLCNRLFFIGPDDRPNFDLTHGIEQFLDRDHGGDSGIGTSSLYNLLNWIRDHQDELKTGGILQSPGEGTRTKLNVDFVIRRSSLGNLLRAGESFDRVQLQVTLDNGTYYIENFRDNHIQSAPIPKQMSFSGNKSAPIPKNKGLIIGKKFLQYVTSADGDRPDIDQPIAAHASHYSVMKVQCGAHSFLISSENKAERKESSEPPPRNYVEVKTSKDTDGDTDKRATINFQRYKTLKWWSLNHISGIPEIMVGWTNDDQQLVIRTEMMRTEELPGKARGSWDPDVCLTKLSSLLADIKARIKDDDYRAVYRLELEEVEKSRGANQRLKYRRFNHLGRRDDDYTILTDWYVKDVLKVQE